tara:strand:- start:92 stop:388 length:297 start_codon:yes stop_codon:yes gene_type:complete
MSNQENNKLIAEFMGLAPNECGVYQTKRGPYHLENLSYHLSWDWLMPVIQKCLIGEAEHSEDVSNLAIKNIYESICNQDISLAHKSVVEFINQYNKNK